jgi:hypothetical protein
MINQLDNVNKRGEVKIIEVNYCKSENLKESRSE